MIHKFLFILLFKQVTFKWTKRPVTQRNSEQYLQTPYFRYGHTCVYYSEHELIYLWGGRSDFTPYLCNNLFSYDPKTHMWSKVKCANSPPNGRDGHTATVIGNSMYIFGGYVQLVIL